MTESFEEILKRARKNLDDYYKRCTPEEAKEMDRILNLDPLIEAYLRPEWFKEQQKGIGSEVPKIPNEEWKDLLA